MTISHVATRAAGLLAEIDATLPALVHAGTDVERLAPVRATLARIDAEVVPFEQALAGAMPEPARDHLRLGRAVLEATGGRESVDAFANYRAGIAELHALATALDAAHPGAAAAGLQSIEGAEHVFGATLTEGMLERSYVARDHVAAAAKRQGNVVLRLARGVAKGTEADLELARGVQMGADLSVERYLPTGSGVMWSAGSQKALGPKDTAFTRLVGSTRREIRDMLYDMSDDRYGAYELAHDEPWQLQMGQRAMELRGTTVATAEADLAGALEDAAALASTSPRSITATGDGLVAIADRIDSARRLSAAIDVVATGASGDAGRKSLLDTARGRVKDMLASVLHVEASTLLPAHDHERLGRITESAGGLRAQVNVAPGEFEPISAAMDRLATRIRGYADDPSKLVEQHRGFAALNAFEADLVGPAHRFPDTPAPNRGIESSAQRLREAGDVARGWSSMVHRLVDDAGEAPEVGWVARQQDDWYGPLKVLLADRIEVAVPRMVPIDLARFTPEARTAIDDVIVQLGNLEQGLRRPWPNLRSEHVGASRLASDLDALAEGADAAADVVARSTPTGADWSTELGTAEFRRLRSMLVDARGELDRAERIGKRAGSISSALPHYEAATSHVLTAVAGLSGDVPEPMLHPIIEHATKLSAQSTTAARYLDANPGTLLDRVLAKTSASMAGTFGSLPEGMFPQRGIAGRVSSDIRVLDDLVDLLQSTAATTPSTI